MEKVYLLSLQMIKNNKIKTRKQYQNLLNDFLLLSIDSLKYISGTRNFNSIIKIANNL